MAIRGYTGLTGLGKGAVGLAGAGIVIGLLYYAYTRRGEIKGKLDGFLTGSGGDVAVDPAAGYNPPLPPDLGEITKAGSLTPKQTYQVPAYQQYQQQLAAYNQAYNQAAIYRPTTNVSPNSRFLAPTQDVRSYRTLSSGRQVVAPPTPEDYANNRNRNLANPDILAENRRQIPSTTKGRASAIQSYRASLRRGQQAAQNR